MEDRICFQIKVNFSNKSINLVRKRAGRILGTFPILGNIPKVNNY
jgi:hypothetical protein